MKLYSKVNENLSKTITPYQLSHIGTNYHGGFDEFVLLTRKFYKDASDNLFDMLVKQVWIDNMFTYRNARRKARYGNGISQDWAYSKFMKGIVGHSQKTITTSSGILHSVTNYFPELFPDFMANDPFANPELYKFPFKNITIDFLYFVENHHERMEMLKYADDKKMTIEEFENWGYNQAICYNLEKDREVYALKRHAFVPYLARVGKLKK
jgi:hypothetical protein